MKKYKLPKEFAEKWVAALRSGEYKQARYQLISGKNYCCLGVACSLNDVTDNELYEYNYTFLGSTPFAIPKLLRQSKFHKECTEMNDIQKKSFPEIADWLCENVEFTTP